MNTKICIKCNIEKLTNEFPLRNKKLNIYRGSCKVCYYKQTRPSKEKKREYARTHREKHREEIKEKKRAYYAQNKIRINEKKKEYTELHKEKTKLYLKEYYLKNKDKLLDKAKQRNIEKKEEIKAYKKEWSKTPKAIALKKQSKANRRALLKDAGKITSSEASNIISNTSNCYWCNTKLDKENASRNIHLDHYVPLSKGGRNTIDNIVVSCAKCNMLKKAKDPISFANSLGKLL